MTANQNLSNTILSDVIHFMKYAKYIPELKRRETFAESGIRNRSMHKAKFPFLAKEIDRVYDNYVLTKKVLPSMRALEDSTPIRTKQGWKTAGTVDKGDILYSSTGKETKVLEVVKFENKPLFELELSNGEKIKACDEHLWIVKTLDDLKNKKPARVVSTKFIREHLKQGSKHNISIANPAPVEFPEKELNVDPYIMGHWLGDGYSSGFQYSTSVEDAAFFSKKYEEAGYSNKQSDSSNIWTFSVRGLKKDLLGYGVIGNKHIPRNYIEGSVQQRLSLVQGLIDTDGHITPEGRCLFANTNSAILEGLKEILASLGISYSESTTKKKKEHHLDVTTISFFTNQRVSLLPRKAQFLRKNMSIRTASRKIVGVTPIGLGNASCFHVDSEDHSFLAGSRMLVTHNSMQFAGEAIAQNNVRMFNCSYLPVDHQKAFSETMYLLLSGTGAGYSVQYHHIDQLPSVKKPVGEKTFVIPDDIAGWADAVDELVNSYFNGTERVIMDPSQIREKGSLLVTSGGKAPGSKPLMRCLAKITEIFEKVLKYQQITKLSSIQVHSIMCHIANAVLAGGIRRSSCIALFSFDDLDMRTCKHGEWWVEHEEFGRANNSAVAEYDSISQEQFEDFYRDVVKSKAGEPGIYWVHDKDVGVNPCKPLHSTILTPTGYITFKEALEKPELTVVLPTGGTAKATKPFKTGTNRIVQRLKLRNGSYVYGTENHKHKTKKGVWVEMKDIQVGDKLAFSIPQLYVPETHEALMSNRDYQKGLLHGWVFADGSVSSSTDVNVCFGVNEFDTSEFFKDTFGLNVRKHGQKPDTCKVATIPVSVQKEFGGFARQADLGKEDLTWLLGETFHTKLGFIRAAFTADGSVRKKNNVELYSISRASLETLQTVLAEMGIYSSIQLHNNSKTYIANDGKTRNNKTVHKLNVYAGQFARIGFISEFKNNRLAESTQECAIYRYKDYQTVVEIEREFSVEDVYDITVDHPSHAFIDSGIVTHNCGEASLRAFSFCNLVDINAQKVLNQKDFIDTCEAAAFINTLQASYTDFKYLRPIWKERTEEDALIGVGITGIAGGNLDALDLHAGSEAVMSENARVAAMIGINPAARCCLIKPSGTTSLVLATSNGIHDWHDHYYIRRAQVNKKEAIYQYLIQTFPALVEDLLSDPDNTAVLSFPQKAPDLASVAPNSNALSILERCKRYNLEWIRPAHRSGANYHNVSATVYVEDEEMDSVRDWLWENRFTYHGLTVFPVNNHTYKQTPFESCTKEVYEKMLESFVGVDLTQVLEEEDFTNLNEQAACFGGVCTII